MNGRWKSPRRTTLLSLWSVAKSSDPTLEFTNYGDPYLPTSNGDLWQIEVRNGNDGIGVSHAHTTVWDDFQVAMIFEPSTALLLAAGLAGLAAGRRRRSLD